MMAETLTFGPPIPVENWQRFTGGSVEVQVPLEPTGFADDGFGMSVAAHLAFRIGFLFGLSDTSENYFPVRKMGVYMRRRGEKFSTSDNPDEVLEDGNKRVLLVEPEIPQDGVRNMAEETRQNGGVPIERFARIALLPA